METRIVPNLDFTGDEELSNIQDIAIVPTIGIAEGPMTFREHLRAFCLARQERKRSGLPDLQEIIPKVKKGKKKHKSPLQ